MNGNGFLVDTNTFIYLLNKHPALEPFLEKRFVFFFYNRIKLLGKPGILKSEIQTIKGILGVCKRVDHVEEINEITIQITQWHKIKLPDAMIAATAVYLKMPLLNYDKGFAKIKEIDIFLLEP